MKGLESDGVFIAVATLLVAPFVLTGIILFASWAFEL